MLPTHLLRKAGDIKLWLRSLSAFGGRHRRMCPICDYKGYFGARGLPARFDALCYRCGSLERHRQHHLLVEKNSHWIDRARVLHFAPEVCFERSYASRCHEYIRADAVPQRGEMKVYLEQMPFDDGSFDTVICHQVLEHVESDVAAVNEIARVLRPGGQLIVSVPYIPTWEKTYRDASCDTDRERDLFFGQADHRRYYGSDFKCLIRASGMNVREHVAIEPEVSLYGLQRGASIFVCSKLSRRH